MARYERRKLTTVDLETRLFSTEIRNSSNGLGSLWGYIAVFDQLSVDLGGFLERVDRHAFDRSLKDKPVVALVAHDSKEPLGWTNNPNQLALRTDRRGLIGELHSIPDTSYGRDLVVQVREKLAYQCSFGFYVIEDRWEFRDGELPIRTLVEVELIEVSFGVAIPAYQGTSSALRSLDREKHSIRQHQLRRRKAITQQKAMATHHSLTKLS